MQSAIDPNNFSEKSDRAAPDQCLTGKVRSRKLEQEECFDFLKEVTNIAKTSKFSRILVDDTFSKRVQSIDRNKFWKPSEKNFRSIEKKSTDIDDVFVQRTKTIDV